jgi:hypothetical protein
VNFHNTLFHSNNFSGNPASIGNKNLLYINSRNDILYKDSFEGRGDDVSFRTKEVHVSRVKFKPGYQRLWRNARYALKDSLNLNFKYQYRLTRYLTRFLRQANLYTFSYSEMSIMRVLLYSRLLPDKNTCLVFFTNKLVYLNGKSVFNRDLLTSENDLIQLIVSKWYYVLYRWLFNWTSQRNKKFKRLVFRKSLAGKHKLMKTRKQKSFYTPNWIYNNQYDLSDNKPYLEVDYFTLSTFVLYDPMFFNYLSPIAQWVNLHWLLAS